VGGSTFGNTDYVTVAVTTSGTTLVAYVPPAVAPNLAITVDMAALSGPVHARWYDPSSGTYAAIAGVQPFANVGKRSFTIPGPNSIGATDWVLLLDPYGGGSVCGSIGSTGLYQAPAALPAPPICHVTAAQQSDASLVAHATINLH
jgi:hypothetical protein